MQLSFWFRWLGIPGAGDLGSILGLERCTGEGNGNPLQYSCLENPHGQRSLAGYSPWGLRESDMTKYINPFIQQIISELKNNATVCCHLKKKQ